MGASAGDDAVKVRELEEELQYHREKTAKDGTLSCQQSVTLVVMAV